MKTILVVEDNINTQTLLKAILSSYYVLTADNGLIALEILKENKIDLALIDIMMPFLDGFSLVKEMRENNLNIPIIMLTARVSIEDKKKGFNLGIDDYVTKPFDNEELLLRIKAIFRRIDIENNQKIVINDIILDERNYSISDDKHSILLPRKEFDIMYRLLYSPNTIYTREQLASGIWESYDEHILNVHINRLRNRLKDFKLEIVTIRGLGYKVVI